MLHTQKDLTEIRITHIEDANETQQKIVEALAENKRVKLTIEWCAINAEDLGEVLKTNESLTALHLEYCGRNDNDATKIANALVQNCTLLSLGLDGNFIGDTGAEELAKALYKNSTLTFLDLSGNSISDRGAKALRFALSLNTTLLHLNLKGNRKIFTQSILDEIEQHLEHNRNDASEKQQLQTNTGKRYGESSHITFNKQTQGAEPEQQANDKTPLVGQTAEQHCCCTLS